MDGHGTSPKGRCEGSPDPSEVSSLGKLSVFLISYNLIIRNDINADLQNLLMLDQPIKLMLTRKMATLKALFKSQNPYEMNNAFFSSILKI